MNALNVLLRMPGETDAGMSAVEVLNRTPLEQLEKKVKELKRHRPAEEVRKAMVERIAHAPLRDFERLKGIYLKYCGDTPK